jgi:hypothetical protein
MAGNRREGESRQDTHQQRPEQPSSRSQMSGREQAKLYQSAALHNAQENKKKGIPSDKEATAIILASLPPQDTHLIPPTQQADQPSLSQSTDSTTTYVVKGTQYYTSVAKEYLDYYHITGTNTADFDHKTERLNTINDISCLNDKRHRITDEIYNNNLKDLQSRLHYLDTMFGTSNYQEYNNIEQSHRENEQREEITIPTETLSKIKAQAIKDLNKGKIQPKVYTEITNACETLSLFQNQPLIGYESNFEVLKRAHDSKIKNRLRLENDAEECRQLLLDSQYGELIRNPIQDSDTTHSDKRIETIDTIEGASTSYTGKEGDNANYNEKLKKIVVQYQDLLKVSLAKYSKREKREFQPIKAALNKLYAIYDLLPSNFASRLKNTDKDINISKASNYVKTLIEKIDEIKPSGYPGILCIEIKEEMKKQGLV